MVGVLPADFDLPSRDISLLVPFSFTPQQMSDQGRGNEFSSMIARLKPGATIEQVNAQMKTIVDRNLDRLPQFQSFARTSGFGGYAIPIRDQLVGDVRAPLYVLQVGVLVVLLIACANVANLLLMRATGRYRELAIRTTLGAGRGRLVRQMLTEGVVLSLLGGIGGLALGLAGVRALIAMSSRQMPGMADASLHPAVLVFTLALAVATGLIFGVVPAIGVMRGNTATILKDDNTRGSSGRGTRLMRSTLVILEMALALMLLVGAGLLIKSFARITDVDPGFSTENVLTTQLSLPATRYADAPSRSAFWRRLVEKATAMPGVTSVGLTSNVPFNGNVSVRVLRDRRIHARCRRSGSRTDGRRWSARTTSRRCRFRSSRGGSSPRATPPTARPSSWSTSISPTSTFRRRARSVSRFAVAVRKRRPSRSSASSGRSTASISGMPVTKERIYYPVAQQPRPSMALTLKTGLDPQTLVPQVRQAVQSLDPEQPMADVRTMDQWVLRSLENRRTPMMLLALFGAVALILSAIGIYGVLAFGVAQRVREFGIRQALGADQKSILRLVLTQGMVTAGIGLLVGLSGAFLLTRFLQSMLFGVGTHDVPVFAGVTVLLLLVAVAACYIPAKRATEVDPMIALRDA